jgi:hypothetical protein
MTKKLPPLKLTEQLEFDILEKTKAGLADVLKYVDQLTGLYDYIQIHYTRHSQAHAMSPQQSVLLQAIITCKHQFVLGMLTLLRGHLGDSFSYLRKALEFTLFAASVLEREGTAFKWLNAGHSQDDWDQYHKEFKIHNMTHLNPDRRRQYWTNLADDLPMLNLIIEAYAESSRRLHATVLAAGPEIQNGRLVYYDAYVDYLAYEEPRRLVEPYFFMLWKHLEILEVQSRVLLKRSGIVFDEKQWLAAFDPIEENIFSSLEQWQLSKQA